MIVFDHKLIVAIFTFKVFNRNGCEKKKAMFRKEEQLSHEGDVGHGLKLS
jgi:hypothetical protein